MAEFKAIMEKKKNEFDAKAKVTTKEPSQGAVIPQTSPSKVEKNIHPVSKVIKIIENKEIQPKPEENKNVGSSNIPNVSKPNTIQDTIQNQDENKKKFDEIKAKFNNPPASKVIPSPQKNEIKKIVVPVFENKVEKTQNIQNIPSQNPKIMQPTTDFQAKKDLVSKMFSGMPLGAPMPYRGEAMSSEMSSSVFDSSFIKNLTQMMNCKDIFMNPNNEIENWFDEYSMFTQKYNLEQVHLPEDDIKIEPPKPEIEQNINQIGISDNSNLPNEMPPQQDYVPPINPLEHYPQNPDNPPIIPQGNNISQEAVKSDDNPLA